MTTPSNCSQNNDPLKLIREGTSQDLRFPSELDPVYAPIDERSLEHAMVFARAYSKYLQFYGSNNTVTGDWEPFFSQDVSVQLAVAAVQDVNYYKNNLKTSFDFLKNNENQNKEPELKNHLGYLFSTIGTLARQLDSMNGGLSNEIALKKTLQNLIQNQLAPAFRRLIAYYKADILIVPEDRLIADVEPDIIILGETSIVFSNIYNYNFSKDWITDNSADWNAFTLTTTEESSVYGSGVTVFERVNHIATHNLFTSIFDQFLKVFARIVIEAKEELEKTFTDRDNHEPHYALFLSFLRLFDYFRAEANTLTQRHLDFYYRDILKLKEKPSELSHAHLLIELAKHVDSHEIKADELFKAGKDDSGIEAFFANDQPFVANQAKVNGLKTLYRHKNVPNDTLNFDDGCLFASPQADSADGLGAKLTTADQSWHPFFNKIYKDGNLIKINMPKAEVGFAIASHYLWMAEGKRTIMIDFTVTGNVSALTPDRKNEIICLLTTEKGWFEKTATKFITASGVLRLEINLSGADPSVIPYSTKIHGYHFSTNLPILLVKLRHQDDHEYLYHLVQDMVIEKIDLTVDVTGLKSLSVSNDFGPVDTSKPFQPFGASPVANSALVIGSKEIFQKALAIATINIKWQNTPSPFDNKTVNIITEYLQGGVWEEPSSIVSSNITNETFRLDAGLDKPVVNIPDFSESAFYDTSSRHGFVRLKTSTDFGQSDYEQALIDYIKTLTDSILNNEGTKPIPPIGPFAKELSLNYKTSEQTITLNSNEKSAFEKRQSHFFHLTPFGQSEQHPLLNSEQKVFLVPQFKFQSDKSNAEFYMGVTGLQPPQNLAIHFQVADGTANPLSTKANIHWSYLSGNEWINFAKHEVQDGTDGLLNSGIITFSIPDEASSENTILPSGQYWLRAAVANESDAVCRLLAVSAQGLMVTFQNHGNDPAFPAKVLPPGTISKLDRPNAAIKKITQPFPTFGGRGKEASTAFYTRVSERLRHKDRAIALWDYERLVLEAFPEIYQIKCLNHTHYEPDEGIYRELASGHVTVIAIPDQQFNALRDPLRPYTGLGLLEEIAAFLRPRMSCFVKLHVKNPLFEEVRVAFKVRLSEGKDESFYLKKLEEDITRFLSPWAFPGGGSPSFGGKIYKSVLINFMEDLPYVDYVTDVRLFQTFSDEDNVLQTVEKIEVEGSKAVSLLVSAGKHTIDILKPAEIETSGEKCPCEA